MMLWGVRGRRIKVMRDVEQEEGLALDGISFCLSVMTFRVSCCRKAGGWNGRVVDAMRNRGCGKIFGT